jgi:23S rRNA pseudouridine2604 synthase
MSDLGTAIGTRINKFISESGICSRRQADAWIEAGRVTLNGVVATLGAVVKPSDTVLVDGQPLKRDTETTYIAFNKPVGITCTTDPEIAGNIVDFINHPLRIFPIGRLDKDSEGLILLTNDGDIVNQILRAENAHEKEYVVTVDKPLSAEFLAGMARGVKILGTQTRPCRTRRRADHVFEITLTQGLNRQIRRMCSVFGYKVRRLQRVRIMNIHLEKLPIGKWRDLSKNEVKTLLQLCGTKNAGLQDLSKVR